MQNATIHIKVKPEIAKGLKELSKKRLNLIRQMGVRSFVCVPLVYEKEALGLFLSGHPFIAVRRDARFFADGNLADIASEPPPATDRNEEGSAHSYKAR